MDRETPITPKRLYVKLDKVNVDGRTGATTNLVPSTPKAHLEFSMELKKVLNERNILTSKTRKRVFDALDEIKTKSEDESRNFKREKALLEIVTSETRYVHQLELIINFFMKPVVDRRLLRSDDFNTVFGNISTIHSVNKELLEELDKGYDNVAHAFSKIAPFLKLYSVYAYEFKNIIHLLQNARSVNPQFAKFIEGQESRPEVQNKLSALLIAPIQRIPRYKLLLSHLHQLTKPSDQNFKNLTECLGKINDVAEHINKVVDDHENMQRLLELQRYLRSGEPTIIKPGRKLLKEGALVRMSTKNAPSEELYTFLMNDIIIFSKMKQKELAVNSLKCLAIYPLGKSSVTEILDKGCMRITCQEEELILYHARFEETKSWIDKIRQAIESHLNDRKTLRKDSSSRRPVKRKDLHEYHEVGLSPGRPMKKRKTDTNYETSSPIRISRRKPVGNRILTGTLTEHRMSMEHTPIATSQQEGTSSSNVPSQPSQELFVFGRPQQHYSFKFNKFFEGVGGTIKKFFGFRK